jgi:hypothetical protein
MKGACPATSAAAGHTNHCLEGAKATVHTPDSSPSGVTAAAAEAALMLRQRRQCAGRVATPGKATARRPLVQLKELIEHGLITPGKRTLRADYKNQHDYADLLADGRILQDGKIFDSPSAFSVFSKRKLTPERQSDDGWKTLKYGEKALEHYKRLLLQRLGMPTSATNSDDAEGSPHVTPDAATSTDGAAGARGKRPRRTVLASSGEGKTRLATVSTVDIAAQQGSEQQGSIPLLPMALPLETQPLPVIQSTLPPPLFNLSSRSEVPLPPPLSMVVPHAVATVLASDLPVSAPLPFVAAIPADLRLHMGWTPPYLCPPRPASAVSVSAARSGPGSDLAPMAKQEPLAAPSNIPKLPPMPRKVKTHGACLPRAPKPAASTTALNCPDAQRSRRDVKAPHRFNGVSKLGHTMMQLEEYSHAAGEAGGDAQPFAVAVRPIVLAAMDVHAHLCLNEVIGVFGGTYDGSARSMVVRKAVPVKEGKLERGKIDVEMDAADQSRAVCPSSSPPLHHPCTPSTSMPDYTPVGLLYLCLSVPSHQVPWLSSWI